jgi:carboxyl-terminal processing protease
MRMSKNRLWLATGLMLLAACGGGGGGTPTPPTGGNGGATPPTGGGQSPASCALPSRKQFALDVLREWYLFPETLPATLDPAPFATVDDYIDALTATARAQRRDRFFTFLTSIKEEEAFFSSGASAGFGFRVATDTTSRRVLISEAFEGAPALAAGIDRGDEILAIGETAATLRPVADIIAAGGSGAVTDAFGPTTPGVTRVLRVTGPSGTRDLTVTKASFDLTPVSSRYGARVIDDSGRRVGYLNLRTFISSADPQLRFAFEGFRQQGITEFVVDFRYNGGGLISTAELMGDLLGGNRNSSEVFSSFVYRPEKSANNSTKRFAPTAQSVAPTRIAFIATGATASASEVVVNGLLPYYGTNLALIGANTFGKPVGQVALDRSACDDRIRVVAFSSRNSANSDNYYDGLAATVPATCRATDDVTRPLGDPQEASLRQALDYLAGRPCTPIAVGQTAQSAEGRVRLLEAPADASAAQREVPGLF